MSLPRSTGWWRKKMNKNCLYLECYSGISGDMTAAALLDLDADADGLTRLLSSLPVDGFRVVHGKTKKQGIAARDFDVIVEKDQPHRHLADLLALLDGLPAEPEVLEMAGEMFRRLGEAEAKAHGIPLEEVHFHEVGAVDSIVDVLTAAYCFHQLHIGEVILSPIYEGQGHVKCAHGLLPVPVPAVRNLAEAYGLPISIKNVEGEMVTPTGAAIASLLWQGRIGLPPCRILKTGTGAGKKDFPHANVLRASLIEPLAAREDVWVLETNLDDCSGEAMGYTLEKLGQAGVRDAFFIPVFMKKNRPGVLLTVVCDQAKIPDVERVVFTHTTTIGIRRYPVERSCLDRAIKTFQTPWGTARVKQCRAGDKTWNYPEYEDVRRICDESGESFGGIYRLIQNLAEEERS